MTAHHPPPPGIRRAAEIRPPTALTLFLKARGSTQRSTPNALPGATTSLVIPITGQTVGSDGRTYTLSGSVTLTLGDPPAPPGPKILSIRDRTTLQEVTTAPGRTVLVIQGQSLGSTGRLQIAGSICTVSSWSDTEIIFAAPALATTVTAPFVIYRLANNQWTELCRSIPFTLTPPVAPVAGGFPAIEGAVDDSGVPLFGLPAPGQVFRVIGKEFGERPGKLLWDNTPSPILAWTDTSIRTRAPEDPNVAIGGSLWLWREDGKLAHTTRFPIDKVRF